MAWLWLLVLAVPSVSTWEATTSAGDNEQGTLVSLDETELTLATATGTKALPVTDLLTVRPVRAGTTRPAMGSGGARMVTALDGSVLRVDDLLATGETARLSLSYGGTATVPVRGLAHALLRDHKNEPELAARWRELIATKRPGDQVILRKVTPSPTGEVGPPITSLDTVEGVIGDITEGEVAFRFSGRPLNVKRERIEGLIWFTREGRQLPAAIGTVRDIEGNTFVVSSVATVPRTADEDGLDGLMLRVVTPTGLTADVPLDLIREIDLSAGKVLTLATTAAERTSFTPQRIGPATPDWDAWVALTRPTFTPEPQPVVVAGKRWRDAIVLRPRTEATWAVPPEMTRFRAEVGVPDEFRAALTGARVVVLADRTEVARVEIRPDQPGPRTIDAPLASVRRVTVVVEDADGRDAGDVIALGAARLTK